MTNIEVVAVLAPDFAGLTERKEDEVGSLALRRAESIGRPFESDALLEDVEQRAGRPLRLAKRGPNPTRVFEHK